MRYQLEALNIRLKYKYLPVFEYRVYTRSQFFPIPLLDKLIADSSCYKTCLQPIYHYIIKPFPLPPSGDHRLKMGNINKPTASPGFQVIMSPIYAYFLWDARTLSSLTVQ